MKNFFKSNGAIICLIVLLFLVMGVVFILLHLFSTRDFSYEICCALIGTIITAVVTVFLLQGQSSSDEKKDKNIRIYENKLDVYSEYVRQMWETISDDEDLKEEEWNNLRVQTFGKLIFYLDTDAIQNLTQYVSEIDKARREGTLQDIKIGFANITRLLAREIVTHKSKQEADYTKLFNQFNINTSDLQDNVETEAKVHPATPPIAEVAAQSTETPAVPAISPIYQLDNDIRSHGFWHFCALNMSKQKLHLGTLALIEYDEQWRTDTIRRIKEGDLIFLFAAGGGGYYGVFRAKNVAGTDSPALVFEVDWDYNGEDKAAYFANKETEYQNKAKAFDIYDGYKDSATSIAAINVETIYFKENGIGGKPVSTRRATIIPFNQEGDRYALLNAFDKAMKENQ